MPALGLVIGVDPDGVVFSHPWDELFVLDADDARECRDLVDQRNGISNQTERSANVWAQRLVDDEQWLAAGLQRVVRRRFFSPIAGLT